MLGSRNKSVSVISFFLYAFLASDLNRVQSLHIINGPQKLKVSIYMTSLCKDTKKFLTNDFYPVYHELKDYLDVEFIPWGKSRRDVNGITCQFGEADCKANRIQSCVLHLMGHDQPRSVEYLACEFVNMFSTVGSYQCAEEAGVPTALAQECADSGVGDDLQRQAEHKTATIPMIFVPTIVYNDHYDKDIQDKAFRQFRKTTCELLEVQFSGACGILSR